MNDMILYEYTCVCLQANVAITNIHASPLGPGSSFVITDVNKSRVGNGSTRSTFVAASQTVTRVGFQRQFTVASVVDRPDSVRRGRRIDVNKGRVRVGIPDVTITATEELFRVRAQGNFIAIFETALRCSCCDSH